MDLLTYSVSVWNSLPVALRDRDISLVQFKRLLKTLWFVWAAAHSDFCFFCAVYTHSNLLTYIDTVITSESLRHTIEMCAFAIITCTPLHAFDLDLWALTLKTFSAIPVYMMNNCVTNYWKGRESGENNPDIIIWCRDDFHLCLWRLRPTRHGQILIVLLL